MKSRLIFLLLATTLGCNPAATPNGASSQNPMGKGKGGGAGEAERGVAQGSLARGR